MFPLPNPHLVDTATPPIPAARAWLGRYDGRLGPPINLAQAVPGVPPPDALLSRLGAAAADPASAGYGPILGEPALVTAYAQHLCTLYDSRIGPGEVAITSGCNEAFFVTVLAIAKAGDAVMLPMPCYFNHEMALTMLGVETVPLHTRAEHGFVPDVAAAEREIDRRIAAGARPMKAIVLVTPNNPTGAVYPAGCIEAFAALARRHGLWLVLDETYRDFRALNAPPPHRLFSDARARDDLIQLYSFSKSYAIPGHRLGALRAPERLMPQILKVLDTLQICAPRAAQAAVSWAIDGMAQWRRFNAADVAKRGDCFRQSMMAASGWSISSIGAYFAFVRHPFSGRSDVDVAEALAVTCGVLGLPGAYFGADSTDHIRFAFANVDPTLIAEAGQRLAALRI